MVKMSWFGKMMTYFLCIRLLFQLVIANVQISTLKYYVVYLLVDGVVGEGRVRRKLLRWGNGFVCKCRF